MQNDGVAIPTFGKVYGKKGRRIRAYQLNERQLKKAEANVDLQNKKLEEISKLMNTMEKNAKMYNAKLYKQAISDGEHYTKMRNLYESTAVRLRNEMQTLKTRI